MDWLQWWSFVLTGGGLASPVIFAVAYGLQRLTEARRSPWRAAAVTIALAAWGGLIAILSGPLFSVSHTGAALAWASRPRLSGARSDAFYCVNVAIRRAAHLTEYGVLFLLLKYGLTRSSRPALAVCAVVAVLDEVHQAFSPPRQGLASDACIDFIGALIGSVAAACFKVPDDANPALARDGKAA